MKRACDQGNFENRRRMNGKSLTYYFSIYAGGSKDRCCEVRGYQSFPSICVVRLHRFWNNRSCSLGEGELGEILPPSRVVKGIGNYRIWWGARAGLFRQNEL